MRRLWPGHHPPFWRLAWSHAELSNNLISMLPCCVCQQDVETDRLLCSLEQLWQGKLFFCFSALSTIKVQFGLTRTLVTFRLLCNQILLTKSECFCWPKRPEIWAVDVHRFWNRADDRSPRMFVGSNNKKLCNLLVPVLLAIAVGNKRLQSSWCMDSQGSGSRRKIVRARSQISAD